MKKIKFLGKWLIAKKKRLLVFGIIAAMLGFGGYKLLSKNNSQVTYQTSKVEKGTIVSAISASGKVISAGILPISTEATGIVKKIYVKDGDRVIVGQKIAEFILDQIGAQKHASSYASYVGAQNSLIAANNSYRSAQASADVVLDAVKGHDTDETLIQKETRTKVEVARDNAFYGIKLAEANLSSLSLSYRLSSPVITAPYGGIIDSIGLVEGMVLEGSGGGSDAGSSNVRVAVVRNNANPIVVTLSEVDVAKVQIGQKATVMFDSLIDKTFTGVVASVDRIGAVSSNVTSYAAKIRLDFTSDEIRPNMAATANIVLQTKTDVLIIPKSGIVTTDGQTTAKVLTNEVYTEVVVEIGLSSDNGVEVISGLSLGDEVVTGTNSADSGYLTTQTRSVFSSGFGGGTGGVRVAR